MISTAGKASVPSSGRVDACTRPHWRGIGTLRSRGRAIRCTVLLTVLSLLMVACGNADTGTTAGESAGNVLLSPSGASAQGDEAELDQAEVAEVAESDPAEAATATGLLDRETPPPEPTSSPRPTATVTIIPTPTQLPTVPNPTATPVPPTATPTATPEPPTATAIPTATSVPPTAEPATPTAEPATATPPPATTEVTEVTALTDEPTAQPTAEPTAQSTAESAAGSVESTPTPLPTVTPEPTSDASNRVGGTTVTDEFPATATPTIPPTTPPTLVPTTPPTAPPTSTPEATVAPTLTPTPSAAVVNTQRISAGTYYVNSDTGLNLRRLPEVTPGGVIHVLDHGQAVVATGLSTADDEGNIWAQLSSPMAGWVASEFLSVTAPPTPTPTVTPVPGTTTTTTNTTTTTATTGSTNPHGRVIPTAEQWLAVRECESSNTYSINTGNGYYGAYQFNIPTWDGVARKYRPHLEGILPSAASPADQDFLALQLYFDRGRGPWPVCGLALPA